MAGTNCDVAVVGGGLVGLSLAYEAACLGADVVLIDAGHPGRATDAGAGILSPGTSTEEDFELWELLEACGTHYPRLLERLGADGVDTGPSQYDVCGLLSIGLRPHEEDWFAPFAGLVLRRTPGVTEISPAEARALFPPLGPVHRVLHHPGAARVDGRGLASALRQALSRRGVRVEQGEVTGILVGDGSRSVRGVRTADGGECTCGALAVAGGAWSGAMGEWLGMRLPVVPMKGQIIHLGVDATTGSWPIAQPLLTHYLVPWADGRVACGGTFEPKAGYDATVTAGGIHELLRECLLVAPGLAGARHLETRAGLRPASPDDRAIVGVVPGWSNVGVATGHGANGLLQGPYTARVLAHTLLGAPLPADEPPLPAAVSPERFG
ncbi:MAG TPA: FAD-dependent oxidoreductase [Acidimicrobiales bacterium]|jgi:D-amino-acid dehydrogenase